MIIVRSVLHLQTIFLLRWFWIVVNFLPQSRSIYITSTGDSKFPFWESIKYALWLTDNPSDVRSGLSPRWMPGQGWPWLEKQKMDGWLHNEWQLKYNCRHRRLVLGSMTGPANETDPADLKTENGRSENQWYQTQRLITLQARLDSQDRPDLTGVKMAATVTIRWLVWLLGPRPLWCWAGLSCLFKSSLPKGSRLFKKGQKGHVGGWAAVFR